MSLSMHRLPPKARRLINSFGASVRTCPIAAEIELLEERQMLSIDLGTASSFAVLGGSAVTNTGPSVISGNLGVSPGAAVTGFPPGLVNNGAIHSADAVATQAEVDVTTAYNALAGSAVTQVLTGQDLGGLTLIPGVYFFASGAQLTGTLTLDAQGDPNAEFIFQIGSTLTTASNSRVLVLNGADGCNVYWQVGSSATIGTTTQFVGNILALTSISVLTGATVDGSLLARNGAVTLDSNVITDEDCNNAIISGISFNDVNGNGVLNPGDLGIPGRTVYIDTNNNGVLDSGEKSTVTGPGGTYTFTNLQPGGYIVKEIPPPGTVQTTVPVTTTVVEHEVVTGVDIGTFVPIVISGNKFVDTNGNAVRNVGEPGLQGVTVFLDTNNNGILNIGERSTVTDVNGNFSFTNLGPGNYIVREVQLPGYTRTTPLPVTITANSGVNVTNVSIGDFATVLISGNKFVDNNGNGVRNVGEPGLQGVTVFLDTNNNGILDTGERTTVTDVNGNFSFTNLGPGNYIVREVQLPGYIRTTTLPATITATSGGNVTGVAIGDFATVLISGNKFVDSNGNGVRNVGEPGLQGVTVFLDTNNNGILDTGERTTITDVNGNFSFANLGPGNYIVREVQLPGYTRTTALPATITATSGGNVTGVAIGNFATVLISGNKFVDSNGNGVRNVGEPGLQGVTVFLDTNNNGILDTGERTTVTDINGNFSFTNLGPGNYIVREVQLPGYTRSTALPATITATSGGNVTGVAIGNFATILISGNKFVDTNGNGVRNVGEPGLQGVTVFLDTNNNGILDTGERTTVTDINGNFSFTNLGPGNYIVREVQLPGYTRSTALPATITATSGGNVTGVAIGNFATILISGNKFVDTNGNGVRNVGEPGLQGVTIFLDTNNNGILNTGERTTLTDINGNFSFTNLGPGNYFVREVQLPGYTRTTALPATITATSGGNVTGVAIGNFATILISGNKFVDTNGNGVRNVGEPGLQGVTVFLDTNNNGILDTGERTTVTDVNGNFNFTNLGPGNYIVREVQLPGYTRTTALPATITATSGGNVTGVAIGNFATILISGNKFVDTNGNGVRNVGEPGLQGVTIFLDTNNNGILNTGERTTVTDVNGNFSFTNLGPGTYIVREVAQTDFVQTTINLPPIIVTSGSNVTGALIGNIAVTSLISPSKLLLTGNNLANLLNGTLGREANDIANLYQTLLNRAPDLNGVSYYLRLFMAGYTQQQVAAIFRTDFALPPVPVAVPVAVPLSLLSTAARTSSSVALGKPTLSPLSLI